jgi:hypothetical protein
MRRIYLMQKQQPATSRRFIKFSDGWFTLLMPDVRGEGVEQVFRFQQDRSKYFSR